MSWSSMGNRTSRVGLPKVEIEQRAPEHTSQGEAQMLLV